MPNEIDPTAAPRVALSWSGGKDSALALHRLRELGTPPEVLLTTITEGYDRISMHGVRTALLEAQARAVGVPLATAAIPQACDNATYERVMTAALGARRDAGIGTVAFGDLHLADVRAYRERLVAPTGLAAAFPLWGEDTAALASRFVRLGFRAVLVCVDPAQLDPALCGREYDDALLDALPSAVDSCGENGEFHTFVYDGPVFAAPVACARGEIVDRGGFRFCDLVPA